MSSDFSDSDEQAPASSESHEVIAVYSSSEEMDAAMEDAMDVDECEEEEEEQKPPQPAPPAEVEKPVKTLFELLRTCVSDEFQHYIDSTQRSVDEIHKLGNQFDDRVREATLLLTDENIKF